MIDSYCAMTLYDAIQLFRKYIIQNYGADSKTAQTYIRIADDFQHYAGDKEAFSSTESIIQEYYDLTIGVPPFQSPSSKYKERSARAIRMIQDIITANEPKRRYLNHQSICPVPYQTVLSRYEILMRNDQKSDGTIYTRSGRMKVFFAFMAGRQCTALGSITPKLFADFVSSLNNRYSSLLLVKMKISKGSIITLTP